MAEIKLTQGHVAIVDDSDYEWLSQFNWFALRSRRTLYAIRNIRTGDCGPTGMHRMILGLIDRWTVTDHIDGNGLNNCRSNLRLATPSQNAANRRAGLINPFGFKGVYKRQNYERWQASICVGKKQRHLGYFGSAEEAARAYDLAAIESFGEFAKLNLAKIAEELK